MAKVQISVDDELLKRIDNYSERNYLSRSGLFTLAASQFLNQAEVSSAIKDMAFCMRKIADTGSVDEETQKQLEDFERLVQLLTGK